MAVGKLNVTPVTVRGRSAPGLDDAKLFVGCFVQETEKHRTHSENGPEPYWKNTLTCTVSEGQNFLHIELVNENPNNGGIVATSKVALNQVFDQGKDTKWIQLNSSSGQQYGELKLELSFSGTNSVSSVTSSFSNMSMTGGQQVSYQQTSTHSQTSSHSQSESRQGSFASLGPANPIPSNYGSGSPPPFTPPAAVSYPERSGNNSMPGSGMPGSGMPGSGMATTGGLLAGDQKTAINTENMSRDEFEEAKAKGNIPTWMKYGGGVLAGAAALGLSAWGAHELKEHYDEKKEEEERRQNQQHHQSEKPFASPPFNPSHQGQQQPYTIHNQQGKQEQHHQQQQYPHPPQQHQSYQQEQHHFEKKEHKDHHKKEKHHKKHGSDSGSSSDSDSSDDERKGKKDKHHKKRDSDWH